MTASMAEKAPRGVEEAATDDKVDWWRHSLFGNKKFILSLFYLRVWFTRTMVTIYKKKYENVAANAEKSFQ